MYWFVDLTAGVVEAAAAGFALLHDGGLLAEYRMAGRTAKIRNRKFSVPDDS